MATNNRLSKGVTRPIFLVGFMAAGKTILGRMLAMELKLVCFDLDHLIETAYQSDVIEIFDRYGESDFRETEYTVLCSLMKYRNPFILSTGGGTPMVKDAMEKMNEKGITVFLDRPYEDIIRSLAVMKSGRPLLHSSMEGAAGKALLSLYNLRYPVYAQAHIHIKTRGKPDQICRDIVSILENH